MPMYWHLFNFIFIDIFFFKNYLCFLFTDLHEICNTWFLKYPSRKKKSQKLSEFRFLIKIFFGQNEFCYLWKQCAPVYNLKVSWTSLDPIGPDWSRLCHNWPDWTKLDQIGPNWTKLDQIGPDWSNPNQNSRP